MKISLNFTQYLGEIKRCPQQKYYGMVAPSLGSSRFLGEF
ncbi:hypothetical protein L581_4217 [Serratia fonticola AU-AP2C]|nr:hypothetical protein L581_4217 [Serratia fonticola AU-AP2C]